MHKQKTTKIQLASSSASNVGLNCVNICSNGFLHTLDSTFNRPLKTKTGDKNRFIILRFNYNCPQNEVN